MLNRNLIRKCGLLMLLGALMVTGRSHAGPAEDSAREHAKSATAAFNLGHYDDAVREYEAAYKLVPDPVLLFNLGQAHRLAGRQDQALAAYRSCLRTAPESAPYREQVKTRIREIEAQTTYRAAGQFAAAPPAYTKPAPNPVLVSTPSLSQSTEPSVAPPTELRWLRWAAVGVTAALGAATVIAGLSTNGRYDDLKKSCGNTPAGCSDDQISSVTTRATTTNVLLGFTGVAAVGTGVIFWRF